MATQTFGQRAEYLLTVCPVAARPLKASSAHKNMCPALSNRKLGKYDDRSFAVYWITIFGRDRRACCKNPILRSSVPEV
jgi:hypothetical protein